MLRFKFAVDIKHAGDVLIYVFIFNSMQILHKLARKMHKQARVKRRVHRKKRRNLHRR